MEDFTKPKLSAVARGPHPQNLHTSTSGPEPIDPTPTERSSHQPSAHPALGHGLTAVPMLSPLLSMHGGCQLRSPRCRRLPSDAQRPNTTSQPSPPPPRMRSAAALAAALLALAPLLLPLLGVPQKDDQDAGEQGHEVDEQVQRSPDGVEVACLGTLHDHL